LGGDAARRGCYLKKKKKLCNTAKPTYQNCFRFWSLGKTVAEKMNAAQRRQKQLEASKAARGKAKQNKLRQDAKMAKLRNKLRADAAADTQKVRLRVASQRKDNSALGIGNRVSQFEQCNQLFSVLSANLAAESRAAKKERQPSRRTSNGTRRSSLLVEEAGRAANARASSANRSRRSIGNAGREISNSDSLGSARNKNECPAAARARVAAERKPALSGKENTRSSDNTISSTSAHVDEEPSGGNENSKLSNLTDSEHSQYCLAEELRQQREAIDKELQESEKKRQQLKQRAVTNTIDGEAAVDQNSGIVPQRPVWKGTAQADQAQTTASSIKEAVASIKAAPVAAGSSSLFKWDSSALFSAHPAVKASNYGSERRAKHAASLATASETAAVLERMAAE
jgi:hypothetical protein